MTSFSVSAAEFVPMSMRSSVGAPNTNTAQDPISMFNQMSTTSSHHGPSAQMGQQDPQQQGGGFCGTKATVCTPFFRQGACSDPACRFAHHLTELDYGTQQQLISMAGGEEFLPIHFVQYPQSVGGPSMGGQRNLFSSAPNTPSNMGGSRTLGGGGRSSGANGTPSSNMTGVSTWEDVRVTLPARCHYPHAIGGTYYDYLNVKRHCAPRDIEISYRSWRGQGYKAAKAIDQTKADAMDRLVVEARLVLGNPIMRVEYDALLPLEEGAVLPPPARLSDEDNIW